MKNFILFTLVVAVAFLTGCDKGSMSKYRIKKITSGKGQSTEFVYTPENKVLSIVSSDSTKVLFAYKGNSIVQTISNPMRGLPRIQTLHVNSAGYVDSSVLSDPSGTLLTLNTHDAEGYNTLTQEYFGGVLKRTTQATFKDGNEVSRTIIDETQKPLGTIFFEYYTDKVNTFSPENQGMGFIGKDSKNLMKKVVQVLAKGDTVGTVTFSYKLDDKGRVLSKSTYDKGALADSATVSYY